MSEPAKEREALSSPVVPIEVPTFYDDEAYEAFARLRREDPVSWYAPLDLWLITKYDDLREVGANPTTFSSAHGISLNDLRMGAPVLPSFFGELLSTTDPPRHRELQRVVAPSFSASKVNELEPQIKQLARDLVEKIPTEHPVEFVSQVAMLLPLQVIALVIGIPLEDAHLLKFWTDEMVKSADVRTAEGLDEARANAAPMRDYFNEWIARSIGLEGPQLIRQLVAGRQSGDEVVTYEVMHMLLSLVLVAGNETTRNFISGGVNAFAENPAQLSSLVADPGLVPSAVEECLRWVTPVRSKVRTVIQPTVLNGKTLQPGQHTLSLFMSGNRDEDIWERSDVFDITARRSSRHLAFGFGEHGCLGAVLARLEGKVLFQELVRRFQGWEAVTAPVRRHPSELHNSIDELMVTFVE